MNQRILIVAGEPSGDIHGAGVVRELKKLNPSVEIFGIGGEKMKSEGMQLIYHIRELSFMGFWEVLKHLPLIRSVEKTLEQLLRYRKPDVILLIDYPGFNLRFARIAKKYETKVFYYISPQIWAWKKKRIKKIKSFIDTMFVVFPFEKELYEKENIPVEFVGHPLVEELNVNFSREQFCKRFDIHSSKKILALVPGSRKQEIHNLFSVMVRAGEELRRKYALEIVVAVAPNLSLELYQHNCIEKKNIKFVEYATHDLMRYADVAIVTSGTATLETACFETPMVVVYRTSLITYWLAKLLVRIKNISLVNIIAEKQIVPELIQHHVTVPALVQKISELLDSVEKYNFVKKELTTIKTALGTVGASARVAKKIIFS